MSHIFYRVYYHITWTTKNRAPIITDQIEFLLRKYMGEKIKENEGNLLAINMVDDHIHILVSIPPKYSISDFVHSIKGSASHFINISFGKKFFY